jgi:hypothetical protein
MIRQIAGLVIGNIIGFALIATALLAAYRMGGWYD